MITDEPKECIWWKKSFLRKACQLTHSPVMTPKDTFGLFLPKATDKFWIGLFLTLQLSGNWFRQDWSFCLALRACFIIMLHYTNAELFFLRYNFISWHTKAQKFQGAAHHLKSLWMVYYGRQQCQMTVIEVIFTFRVMVGMETISKRMRCCCAMLWDKNRRGRKRTKIE